MGTGAPRRRRDLQPQADSIACGLAEGFVRVAIAVARSRGGGISVGGVRTALKLDGLLALLVGFAGCSASAK